MGKNQTDPIHTRELWVLKRQSRGSRTHRTHCTFRQKPLKAATSSRPKGSLTVPHRTLARNWWLHSFNDLGGENKICAIKSRKHWFNVVISDGSKTILQQIMITPIILALTSRKMNMFEADLCYLVRTGYNQSKQKDIKLTYKISVVARLSQENC